MINSALWWPRKWKTLNQEQVLAREKGTVRVRVRVRTRVRARVKVSVRLSKRKRKRGMNRSGREKRTVRVRELGIVLG